MFDPKPGANDWYDIPKKMGKVFFTEPYEYPIEGKPVLMASLVAPIMIEGKFQGTASADFMLPRLTAILAEQKVIDGGKLALLSNGGLYASHPQAQWLGKLRPPTFRPPGSSASARASPMNTRTAAATCTCCSRCRSTRILRPGPST
ncbi:cache domain-containing protein [Massilia sp. H-1]|nr:cache domain-containing protein [Massilia sp. H-1]